MVILYVVLLHTRILRPQFLDILWMGFFFFVPIHSIRSTKLKNENLLPLELLAESVTFLPFDFKWAKLRVSIVFDFFVLKNQRQWIVDFGKIIQPVSYEF